MLKFGARMVAPVNVVKLTPARSADDLHVLHLDCGAEIRSRVVLLALGVRWRQLEAAGADRFAGAGIYYACTTVEADLYDGTDVAVVGGGNSAGQAVMFLAECCPSRRVHLLIRRTLGPGMSDYLSQRIRATANVVIHEQTEIEAIHGNRHMEAIATRNHAHQSQRRKFPAQRCSYSSVREPAANWLPTELEARCERCTTCANRLRCGSSLRDHGRAGIAIRAPLKQPCQASWPPVTFARGLDQPTLPASRLATRALAVTWAHRLLSDLCSVGGCTRVNRSDAPA